MSSSAAIAREAASSAARRSARRLHGLDGCGMLWHGSSEAEPSSRPIGQWDARVPAQDGPLVTSATGGTPATIARNACRPHAAASTGVTVTVEPFLAPTPSGPPTEPDALDPGAIGAGPLSRRGFLRVVGVAGLTGVAATVAACTASATPQWSFGAPATPAAATAIPSAVASAVPSASAVAIRAGIGRPVRHARDASLPPGWSEHDAAARNVIRRYVGNLAPALKAIFGDEAFAKIADMLAVDDAYPELQQKPAFVQVPQLFLSDALDTAQARDSTASSRSSGSRSTRSSRRSTSSSPPSPRLASTSRRRAPRSGSRRGRRSARSSPTTSRRRPASTSTASSSTTSSWTGCRS